MEDVSHLLVSCRFLHQCCNTFARWNIPCYRFGSVMEAVEGLKREAAKKIPSLGCTIYCYLVYQCWKNRLAYTHGQPHASPSVVAASVMASCDYGLDPSVRDWSTTALFGVKFLSSWCPPPHGWIKANFDGSLLGDGSAGCGLVIRDEFGELLVAAGRGFRHWDPGMAEIAGFWLLRQCLEARFLTSGGLIVEGDCVNVIRHVAQLFEEIHKGRLTDIGPDVSFLLDFHNVLFLHASRSCNRLADFCANFARTSDFLWKCADVAPVGFVSILLREKIAVIP